MTPEGRVLAEVIAFLKKVPGVRVSRNHSGMTRSYKQYGCFSPGGSDLIGWRVRYIPLVMGGSEFVRYAEFLAIEVKQPGEDPTPEQARFLQEVKEADGTAGCVHSVEEAAALLGVHLA